STSVAPVWALPTVANPTSSVRMMKPFQDFLMRSSLSFRLRHLVAARAQLRRVSVRRHQPAHRHDRHRAAVVPQDPLGFLQPGRGPFCEVFFGPLWSAVLAYRESASAPGFADVCMGRHELAQLIDVTD